MIKNTHTHTHTHTQKTTTKKTKTHTHTLKLGMEGNFLNILKVVYEKPTSNIIFSGEQLKAFPLK